LKMVGTPDEIFLRAEELKALSLGVPPAVDLSMKLRERGIEVTEGILDIDEMVEYLCR